MKILLTLFVLLFSSSVMADDISDFQIEGMSIGDSALDYFDRELIYNKTVKVYNDDKYTTVEFISLDSFDVYDALQINFIRGDNKFIIEEIAGLKKYKYNINDCHNKIEKIIKQIKTNFDKPKIISRETKHRGDKSGKSKVKMILIKISPQSKYNEISLQCIDWSKAIESERNWMDHLRITIRTKEFSDWINNEAYK